MEVFKSAPSNLQKQVNACRSGRNWGHPDWGQDLGLGTMAIVHPCSCCLPLRCPVTPTTRLWNPLWWYPAPTKRHSTGALWAQPTQKWHICESTGAAQERSSTPAQVQDCLRDHIHPYRTERKPWGLKQPAERVPSDDSSKRVKPEVTGELWPHPFPEPGRSESCCNSGVFFPYLYCPALR